MMPGSGRGPEDREGQRFDSTWDDVPDAEGGSGSPPEKRIRPEASEIARRARESRESQAQSEMDWMMTVSPAHSGFGRIAELAADEKEDAAEAKPRPEFVAPGVSAMHLDAPRRDGTPRSRGGPERGLHEPSPAVEVEAPVAAQANDAADTADGGAPQSNGVLWAAGLAAVAAAGLWLATRQDEAPGREARVAASAATGADRRGAEPVVPPPRPAQEGRRPSRAEAAAQTVPTASLAAREPEPPSGASLTPSPSEAAAPPVASPPEANATASAADLRTPPPGTSPAAAEAFANLPISPADGPPLAGIGATGVYVDEIEMGDSYEHRKCIGESKRFSMASVSRASVCVRVVHPREKEDVAVVWEQSDGTSRRGKLHVPASHAYRTRAYLMLRREYVGDWTVRILSSDGVELAAYAFEVTG